MPRLVLVNGAPGSGKSTIAHALAQGRALALALDIDGLKHSLGSWDRDPLASGLHARRLALALASEQMDAGADVVIGQYLAKTAFIEDLERLAERHGAGFVEVVLDLDAAALARRLKERAANPSRIEHTVNNRLVGRLVGAEDADALVASLEPLKQSRPRAHWVDATGSLAETLALVRARLATEPTP